MKSRNKFYYLLKVNEVGLIKNDKIRQNLAAFGYLPRPFTSFRLRKTVLFRTTLHKTTLLPISRLFLHRMHEQWCQPVDILHCNVAREQVQIWDVCRWGIKAPGLVIKMNGLAGAGPQPRLYSSLNSTWAIPVDLERDRKVAGSDGPDLWPCHHRCRLWSRNESVPIFPGRSSKPTVMNVDWSNFWGSLRDSLSYILLIFFRVLSVFSYWDCFLPVALLTRWDPEGINR